MTPERLGEGLAAAARVRRDDLLDLAEQVAAGAGTSLLEAPRAASVMLELESPAGAFCVAEVVVTTAQVRVGEARGWGCALGWDPEGALAAALADAAGGADAVELAEAALADEREARTELARAVAGTRVGDDG